MDDSDRERRQALDRLREEYGGYTIRNFNELHDAVRDLTPESVEAGVTNLIRDRQYTKRPPIGQVRSYCLAAANHRGERRGSTETPGDGVGCPHCRHEYPLGTHAPWRGDGKLIACLEHNVMWPGSSHDPYAADDGGPLNPQEWHARALAGDYGTMLQAAAQKGAEPATFTDHLTMTP